MMTKRNEGSWTGLEQKKGTSVKTCEIRIVCDCELRRTLGEESIELDFIQSEQSGDTNCLIEKMGEQALYLCL